MVGILLVVLASLAGWIGLLLHVALEALWRRLQHPDRRTCPAPLDPTATALPVVTIQLPVYNEFYVVERLIDSCCALDYPRHRLEIQVLDDSTDETTALIERKVVEYRAHGFDIHHLRRGDRTGFKGGNLQHGLGSAKGEFLAIFDADFVPDPDFLLAALPLFHGPDVGIVYPRHVRHMNWNTSIVTLAQDPVGPSPRKAISCYRTGESFNFFFGSPGIVRRSCLVDVDGWRGDTLCEDEDFTIRSYLRGWRCVAMDQPMSSDEVPERIDEVKQQFIRWKKGNAECYRKHFAAIVTSDALPLRRKIAMTAALHQPWLYVPCLTLAILASVPLLLVPPEGLVLRGLLLLHTAMAVICLFGAILTRRSLSAVTNVFLQIGLYPRVTWGIVEGFLGIKTPFFRSPKRNSAAAGASGRRGDKYPVTITTGTFLEGGFALYLLWGLYLAVRLDHYWLVPFHVLCVAAFGFVFALSVVETIPVARPFRVPARTDR